MRVQDLQARLLPAGGAGNKDVQRHAQQDSLDPRQELLEAGLDLLREFVSLTNWDHPAAERYRKAHARVTFGEES